MRTRAVVLLTLLLLFTLCETTPYQHLVAKTIKIYAPAVARTSLGEKGVLIEITITLLHPGSGRVYVSTMPLTEVDMQASLYTAAKVAHELAGIPFSEYDYLIYIKSPAVIVGGPSASAYVAVAIYALLANLTLQKDVSMTGFIAPDGSIGPVGGILEKIEAAASIGVKTFLVPVGQTVDYQLKIVTRKIGPFTLSTVVREKVNVAEVARKKWGIKVVEVWNLEQAIEYFTGKAFPKNVYEEKPSKEYLSKMKNIAEKVLAEVQALLEEKSGIVSNSTKKAVNKIIGDALKFIKDNKPYLAYLTLKTALIKVYYDEVSRKWSKREVSEVKKIIDSIRGKISELSSLADRVYSGDIPYALLLCQEVTNSQRALDKAFQYYKSFEEIPFFTTLEQFLYKLSEARAHIKCAEVVAGSLSANTSVLDLEKQAALLLSEAKSAIAYTMTLTSGSDFLSEAEALFELARSAYMDQHYLLTCERALRAVAYATTDLNLMSIQISGALSQYLNYSKILALKSIAEVKCCVDPALAYACFEYAEYSSNYAWKILYYKLASMYSKALLSLIKEKHRRTVTQSNGSSSPSKKPPSQPSKPSSPLQSIWDIIVQIPRILISIIENIMKFLEKLIKGFTGGLVLQVLLFIFFNYFESK